MKFETPARVLTAFLITTTLSLDLIAENKLILVDRVGQISNCYSVFANFRHFNYSSPRIVEIDEYRYSYYNK